MSVRGTIRRGCFSKHQTKKSRALSEKVLRSVHAVLCVLNYARPEVLLCATTCWPTQSSKERRTRAENANTRTPRDLRSKSSRTFRNSRDDQTWRMVGAETRKKAWWSGEEEKKQDGTGVVAEMGTTHTPVSASSTRSRSINFSTFEVAHLRLHTVTKHVSLQIRFHSLCYSLHPSLRLQLSLPVCSCHVSPLPSCLRRLGCLRVRPV